MATDGTVIQSWVSRTLVRELKQQAELERRSVSALVRLMLQDGLRTRRDAGHRPTTEQEN